MPGPAARSTLRQVPTFDQGAQMRVAIIFTNPRPNYTQYDGHNNVMRRRRNPISATDGTHSYDWGRVIEGTGFP